MEDSSPFIRSHTRITKRSNSSTKTNTLNFHYEIATVTALLIPLAFTTGHMLLFSFLYSEFKPVTNKETCNCSCWDTIFKGTYASCVFHSKIVVFSSGSA